jgi:hypothetical protein
MALKPCPKCGASISEHAKRCPKCGFDLTSEIETESNATTQTTPEPPTPELASTTPPTPQASQPEVTTDYEDDEVEYNSSRHGWRTLAITAIVLICVALGIGGYLYYQNIYLPEKIDREAMRTYPIVNLRLRSSKMVGGDFNNVTTVPYGGELITYEIDSEWAKVKYILPSDGTVYEGYVASAYLVNKKDFYITNSLLGDNDVREELATAKVRKALLDYFNSHNYAGKLSEEMQSEVGLSVSPSDQWQVVFHRGQTKPNEVFFKRLVDPSSKFTDMAVLIENVSNQRRIGLIFHFDDDETSHLIYEDDYNIPQNGYIKDVVYTGFGWNIIMDYN